jgi:hypothetical protein
MSTRLVRSAAYSFGSTRPARANAWRLGAVSITDTGLRGFLKWARDEYPPKIYQVIASQIQQLIPQGFSGYMLGGWRTLARLNGLGDSASPTVDTAEAANSTPTSPSWGDMISQIIGTATGAYLNVAQQQNQAAIIQAQLQAAQNGKAPLPISLSSSGITFGQAGVSAVGVIIAVTLGYLLFGTSGRGRR